MKPCAFLLSLVSIALVGCATSTTSILRHYLEATDTGDRAALGRELAAMPPDDLLDAIRAMEFDANLEAGILERTLKYSDGFTRPYWVRIPENYDSSCSYPLIVELHGGTVVPADWGRAEIEKGWPEALETANVHDVILVGPCSDVEHTTKDAWWWRLGGCRIVTETLRDVKSFLNVDDDCVFVAGMSGGGCGCYMLAYRAADDFAAFLPYSADMLVPNTYGLPVWFENLKGANIRHIHGADDTHYKKERVVAIVEAANRAGASIDLKVYEGAGHERKFMIEHEYPRFLKDTVGVVRRNLLPESIDYVTDTPSSGRRAWLSIDELDADAPDDAGLGVSAPMETLNVVPDKPKLGLVPVMAKKNEPPVSPAKVYVVSFGGVAYRHGMREGDVIVSFNDVPVASGEELWAALDKLEWGQTVKFVIARGEERFSFEQKLEQGKLFQRDDSHLQARVVGRWHPGLVDIRTRNVKVLSVWVAPQMLDERGMLEICANGVSRYRAAPEPDTEMILSEFASTGDRKRPFVSRIVINLD
ncbi:MAG: PDZ domain-containing protein [Planctomycetaceae bacterium]|nr:PDZ domain-containing protein [Planctomycetaceae bacterium]